MHAYMGGSPIELSGTEFHPQHPSLHCVNSVDGPVVGLTGVPYGTFLRPSHCHHSPALSPQDWAAKGLWLASGLDATKNCILNSAQVSEPSSGTEGGKEMCTISYEASGLTRVPGTWPLPLPIHQSSPFHLLHLRLQLSSLNRGTKYIALTWLAGILRPFVEIDLKLAFAFPVSVNKMKICIDNMQMFFKWPRFLYLITNVQ